MRGATWIPAVHFTPGRERPVRRIVLHWMDTNLAGCDAVFTGGARQASAHYGLEDGTRHQYVHEADTAWHAGVRTINHESIGIEHSAQPGRPASAATIADSIALCTDLCRDYGLTADDIDQHSDFYATQCPGTLPVSRIREAVRANLKENPDMALTDADARTLWRADIIPSPDKTADNPNWQPDSYLRETYRLVRSLRALVASQSPDAIAAAVKAAMPAAQADVDVDALARAIVVELGKD